ncbi:hypothetical protein [Methylomonas sp. MgM2]
MPTTACSDLPRAVESARALGFTKSPVAESLFRESAQQHFDSATHYGVGDGLSITLVGRFLAKLKAREFQKVGKNEEKGACGSGDLGSILFAMKPITGSMPTTFIGTRSSVAGLDQLKIGPIQVFMVMRNRVCILKIGVLTSIYRS